MRTSSFAPVLPLAHCRSEILRSSHQVPTRDLDVLHDDLIAINADRFHGHGRRPCPGRSLEEVVALAFEAGHPRFAAVGADLEVGDGLWSR